MVALYAVERARHMDHLVKPGGHVGAAAIAGQHIMELGFSIHLYYSYQILDKTKAPVSKDRLASVHVLYYLRFSLACQQLSVVVFAQASLLALEQLLVA